MITHLMPLADVVLPSWTSLDTSVALVGAACGVSCALLGVFLMLRKMSMMGDAISHAVLPGLAIAFLITQSRDSMVMLAGAGVIGVITALLTQWIHREGQVEQGASMGVVFTLLFAVGLLLIVQAADHVDLDPGCVLYGAIETTPLVTHNVLGVAVPRAGITIGVALLIDLVFVLLCYKELKISTFDPALSTTMGINANLMHYLLMTLVAVTTVAAFESVGSILVIAMLIVPAATAYMLTDRLSVMLLLACGFAAISAPLGHWTAIVAPGWLGYPAISVSTAGMMAVVSGVMFGVAMLVGPRYGLISRWLHRLSLTLRIMEEDVLATLFRWSERKWPAAAVTATALLEQTTAGPSLRGRMALFRLRRRGQISRDGDAIVLTDKGSSVARALVRSHRLWETYLSRYSALTPDHIHGSAEQLEHVTDEALRRQISEKLEGAAIDPHGSPIPPESDADVN